jgi:hypothetical protein
MSALAADTVSKPRSGKQFLYDAHGAWVVTFYGTWTLTNATVRCGNLLDVSTA